MARLFDDASSQYLRVGAAATGGLGPPFTFACWFYPDDLAAFSTLLWLGDPSSNTRYWRMLVSGSPTNVTVQAISDSDSSGNAQARSTTTPVVNAWNHACGVFAGTFSRTVYHNGAGAGTNTNGNSGADSFASRTTVGATDRLSPVHYMSGRIAEVGVWKTALSDYDILALARGVPPRRVRPDVLTAYWPLWGTHSPEIDLHPGSTATGRYDLAVSGATRANHAPVMPFSRRR